MFNKITRSAYIAPRAAAGSGKSVFERQEYHYRNCARHCVEIKIKPNRDNRAERGTATSVAAARHWHRQCQQPLLG